MELGVAAPVVKPDDDAKRKLPLFLSQIYEPFLMDFLGRSLRLMVLKRRDNPTPAELENHAKLLRRHLEGDVVFLFETLAAFERNRLLKRQIPFIVPHRQMFLPSQLVDLREVHSPAIAPKDSKILSMPAQLLLLYHLQKRPEQVPFALYEWATALRYSRMSISRAAKELIEAKLAESTDQSKTVRLLFIGDRRELWQRALPMLRTPVMAQAHYRFSKVWPQSVLEAGLTALAHYTDLADGRQRTFALWRLFVRPKNEFEQVPFAETDTVPIERWWYPPAVLSDDEKTVDRLSLYLSLRNDADERVQAALTQMLGGMRW